MAFYGADVAALRALASTFQDRAAAKALVVTMHIKRETSVFK